jgi:Domain of unknown function (DUF4062)
MKVFISSVRRGLEEERDALPGLISAIGHTPVRFEDFTAQSLRTCRGGLRCPLNVHSGHESENHALVVPICPSSTMTSVGSQIALHFLSNRLHCLCTRLRTTAPRTISPSRTALSTCN